MNLSAISFSNEPAVWIALADALLMLGVTFGAPITPEQKGAVDAVLSVLAGVIIRSQVTPVAKAATVPVSAAPGEPVTAVSLEQRIDELWTQRQLIDAQLAQIGSIAGPPPPTTGAAA